MSSKDYGTYLKELKETHIRDEQWAPLKDGNEVTLVVGAGITSCLVGNWNDLLNELAVLRGVSGGEDVSPQQMLDFLEANCGGKFLSDTTDVLEKGEYLRFSPKDLKIFEAREKAEEWIETVFADRVRCAIERLTSRKLRDAGGKTFAADYKEDFLAWCRDTLQEPFHIKRRLLSDSEETGKILAAKSVSEIADALHTWYGISLDETALETEIAAGRGIAAAVSAFAPLFTDRSDAAFRRKVSEILGDPDLEKEEPADRTRLFLARISAYLLWRPSYETLEAALYACVNGRIRHVITYNFDTIFDRLLSDKEVQDFLREKKKPKKPVCVYGITHTRPLNIEGFSEEPDSSGICIYHVHGIVDKGLKEDSRVIFSETSYLSFQEVKLNPGSMDIAEAFFRGHMICVGFSGSDANFRSVVRQKSLCRKSPSFSADFEKKIFVTRSLNEITNYYGIDIDKERKLPEKDVDAAFLCAETNLSMQEEYYFEKHGVTILWAESFKDMAKRIKETFAPSDDSSSSEAPASSE